MAAFTTIAAAVGLASTAASTVMSFTQAGEQKRAQRQAEQDADEAMKNARKKLEKNFYAAQGIKKEPYELEREALLSQGAQAIQAGVESERGVAATAGRVQLAQQQGQAAIRSAMGQELTALESKQLGEESRLRDVGVQLDLGEVEGAQLAAANAQELAAQVIAEGADIGIAFDGDGDRLIAVAASGALVDGDHIMAIAAVDLAHRGLLRNKGIAVTVMTNLGFHHTMRDNNIDVVITPVGDRSVLVALDEFDFVLGGEQSGHVIHRAHATTGDGLLAALQLVEYITRARVTLDQAASIMQSYPQILVNIRTLNRVHDPEHDIAEQIAQAEAELGDNGRILVRSSGTEPLLRVMVEAADQVTAESIAMRLAQSLVDIHGGSIEGTH